MRRIGMWVSVFLIWCMHIVRFLLSYSRSKAEIRGVRVIVLKGRHVVLVSHWYAPWVLTLPGGTVNRDETPEAAAIREVQEETGLTIKSLAGEIGTYTGTMGKRDKIRVYYTGDYDGGLTILPSFEIMGRSWFDIDSLPEELSPANRRRIEAYRAGVRGESGKW